MLRRKGPRNDPLTNMCRAKINKLSFDRRCNSHPRTSLADPMQIAALAAAVAWPLVAGVGVVMWSKSRAAKRARTLIKVDGLLRSNFRTVANQPAPEHFRTVVDALEERDAIVAAAAGRRHLSGVKTRA